MWSKRKAKVAFMFLLTLQLQTKDFVLLALLKLIPVILIFKAGEPSEETGWGQQSCKEEREAQKDPTHARGIC